MIDDPEILARKSAYLDTLRGMYKRDRLIGFCTILVGVALVMWARLDPGAPPPIIWLGLGVLAGGWVLFTSVVVRRSRWARANPFNPNA